MQNTNGEGGKVAFAPGADGKLGKFLGIPYPPIVYIGTIDTRFLTRCANDAEYDKGPRSA